MHINSIEEYRRVAAERKAEREKQEKLEAEWARLGNGPTTDADIIGDLTRVIGACKDPHMIADLNRMKNRVIN